MDPSGHPIMVTSPEMTMPGNLEILAQTAASQSADSIGLQDTPSFSGYPVLKMSDGTMGTPPILTHQIKLGGQPGGPMLSQAQLQKILANPVDPDKGFSPGPLSIITTTGFSDPGQPSPASLSQNSQILHYRPSASSGDAMLSAINYNENEMLPDGGFDVTGNLGNLDDGLLAGMGNPARLSENPPSHTFDLFDGEGDSLNIEALSPPGLMIVDTGGLSSVSAMDSSDSNPADISMKDEKKKSGKSKGGKTIKAQMSPGKTGTFDCNQCHKSFNNTSALAKHKLTHSDERKYLCTICEKKFKRQDHLNGHLMTHRDRKPYQCMVVGCDKSYCDARSLRRHLENHHQHTQEQIAAEMVSAASMAAEVLAEVCASMPTPPTQKQPIMSSAINNGGGVKVVTASNSNSSNSNSNNSTSTVTAENRVLAQQLAISPVIPVAGTTFSVTLPLTTNQTASTADPQQSALISQQFEALIKQQQQQQQHEQQQLQLLQEQRERDKAEAEEAELIKQLKLEQMERQAIVAASQLQQEQQQQQQQQQTVLSWQEQHTPNIQSPRTSSGGEPSPGYTEMSPSNHDLQQHQSGIPTSPGGQLWYNSPPTAQQGGVVLLPPANVTVADAKAVDDLAKPVVCTICQRRFKNIPALNGHMRLHGGYFKKETALKEEKKRKKEMAPPSLVPSRPGFPAHLSTTPPGGGTKKTKGTPPLQSPPSEELHAQHWQQKQQEQLQQQQQQQQLQHELQIHQQQLLLQQQQQQQIKQQQLQQPERMPQTVHEHLKQQEKHQQQLEQQQQQQLSALELLQLAHQQAGLGPQQLEQLKFQINQQQQVQQQLQAIQNQHQEKQQHQQQFMFNQQQQQQHDQFGNIDHSPQVPQSPRLPSSPPYPQSPHIPASPHVPQSPQVPQSPLLQRQGSVEHLQSPTSASTVDYSSQGHPQLTPGEYGSLHEEMAPSLLHRLQQQMQIQSQDVNVNHLQGISANIQDGGMGGVQTLNQRDMPPQSVGSHIPGHNLQHVTFNPSVNIHHDNSNSAFQLQIPSSYANTGHLSGEDTQVSLSSGQHHTSQIVSEIITSLEDLGEVPPGSMQQIKPEPHIQQSAYNSEAGMDYQPQQIQTDDNGMLYKNKQYSEFAHNTVVHNQVAPMSQTLPYVSHNPSLYHNHDSRGSVKQELLKHLTSKPSSPRATAAQPIQFSFQPTTSTVQTSVKHKLPSLNNPLSPQPLPKHSEIKRRLSAGSDDKPYTIQHTGTTSEPSRDFIQGTYVKPAPDMAGIRPRMRSKSGEDFRLHKWRNEDSFFTRPKQKPDDTGYRPRSKTDEHLAKWNNRDMFSRSDGGGVFRNPASGSFKIKRKNRPAPLIIPTHVNQCGFQSRLRSPRIWHEGVDMINSAPVPYTPPPMLSPIRRGSGLFWSLQGPGLSSSHPPPQIPQLQQPQLQQPQIQQPQTPRPSLIRSSSLSLSRSGSEDKTVEDIAAAIAAVDKEHIPESDVQPHVNIGSQYQAVLPVCNSNKGLALLSPSYEDLVWDPACIEESSDDEVITYQDLACSSAVKGNGSNVEHALHLLYLSNGNIQNAMLKLMTGPCKIPSNHSFCTYTYQESDIWSSEEVDNYTRALLKIDKDFFSLAKEVKTKTVRQCVQFYYLWKKVLIDDYKRLRTLRRKREQDYNLRSTRQQVEQQSVVSVKLEEDRLVIEEDVTQDMDDDDETLSESSTSLATEDQPEEKEDLETQSITRMDLMSSPASIPSPVPPPAPPVIVAPPTPNFHCDYPNCNASFTSKSALNAHIKIHVRVSKSSHVSEVAPFNPGKPKRVPTPPSKALVYNDGTVPEEMFPCKLCNRVFAKVKSRSAHMKIHRPDQDKEKEKKAKLAKQQATLVEKALQENMYKPLSSNGPL